MILTIKCKDCNNEFKIKEEQIYAWIHYRPSTKTIVHLCKKCRPDPNKIEKIDITKLKGII